MASTIVIKTQLIKQKILATTICHLAIENVHLVANSIGANIKKLISDPIKYIFQLY